MDNYVKLMVKVYNYPSLVIKIYSIDAFLRETKESGKKKCYSALRSEILIVKVCHFSGHIST